MTLEGDIRRLGAVKPLALLGTEALRLIAFSADTRTLLAGDILFRRGESADSGFVLLEGSIGVEGPGPGEVQVVGPGALLGARALVAERARPATATAREASSVLRITRRLFYRVLAEFPEGAERIRTAMAEDLAERLVRP